MGSGIAGNWLVLQQMDENACPDFRGRRNSVRILSAEQSSLRQELIRGLSACYPELGEQTAEPVSVAAVATSEGMRVQSEARLPFPAIADEHNDLSYAAALNNNIERSRCTDNRDFAWQQDYEHR
jgi:hypothetical protein